MPDLTPEALRRAALRQISAGVRRAGAGHQVSLGAFTEAAMSSGPLSKEVAACLYQVPFVAPSAPQ